MILTPEDRSRRFLDAGVWSRITLDNVFRKGLITTPDDVVFRDVGIPAVPGTGARFTFAEAERRIDGLAAFFTGLGLKPDMVVGLHLPASADACIITLAALRAGLIVCPLPLHWNRVEIEAAVQAAAIRGVVTASLVEDDPTGELVRGVAAETFAIRFVFSIGQGVPDGLIDLADVLADLDALGPAPEVQRRGAAADHVALLSFARAADDRLTVVPFSHNHLVATALAHVLEAGLDRSETILSTLHPASLGGFAGGMLSALIAGGSIAFHHPTSLSGLAAAVEEADAARVLLPAPFGPALAAVTTDIVSLSLVASGLEAVCDGFEADRSIVDLTTFGGLCLVPRARPADGQPSLPLGAGQAPWRAGAGPVLYETRLRPRGRPGERRGSGELLLSGAIIPDAPWPEPASRGAGTPLSVTADGQLRTGIDAHPAPGGIALQRDGERIYGAGRSVSATRLDALFRRHPFVQDAAVFPLDAGAAGSRIGVAVVPKPGRSLELIDILLWLDGESAGTLDRPVALKTVPDIPRAADGTVLREALFLKAVA